MYRYTIQCTPEQTLRARALGANIICNGAQDYSKKFPEKFVYINRCDYIIPTVEQMCGWLRREKNIEVWAKNFDGSIHSKPHYETYAIAINKENGHYKWLTNKTPATHDYIRAMRAGIDVALTYLEQEQKGE